MCSKFSVADAHRAWAEPSSGPARAGDGKGPAFSAATCGRIFERVPAEDLPAAQAVPARRATLGVIRLRHASRTTAVPASERPQQEPPANALGRQHGRLPLAQPPEGEPHEEASTEPAENRDRRSEPAQAEAAVEGDDARRQQREVPRSG